MAHALRTVRPESSGRTADAEPRHLDRGAAIHHHVEPCCPRASGRGLVDHPELHPHRRGADLDRLVDVASGRGRTPEDVDHVDLLRHVGQRRVAGHAEQLLARRVDRYHLVAARLQHARDPVAVASRVGRATHDRPGAAVLEQRADNFLHSADGSPCARRSSSPASTTRCSRRRASPWCGCWSASASRSTSRSSRPAAGSFTCTPAMRARPGCGQVPLNSCYAREVKPLMRRFVRVFADAEVVVSPSASCVGMVRDQYPKLAAATGDPVLVREVEQLAPRVVELTELLVDRLGVTDVGAYYPHRVTYHPTCHGLRGLALGDRPLALLRAVRGMELIALDAAEECCGFGGTFAVKNADTSAAMLADKLSNVLATDAEVCTAGDNSCLMHIGGGLRRMDEPVRAVHLAEILATTEEDPA